MSDAADSAAPARRAWAATRVHVHEGDHVLVSLPVGHVRDAATLMADAGGPFAALVREPAEVTLTLAASAWADRADGLPDARVDGPYRVITLDAELELDLVGYLAPAATRLADAGVGIVPQCGYRTDHLLVHAADLGRAVAVLEAWIRECAAGDG